jgi:CPA2 family monovalent cation:H+ antiporter-2
MFCDSELLDMLKVEIDIKQIVARCVEIKAKVVAADEFEKGEMILRQLLIDENSPFLGKTLKDAGIRQKYHCLVAGIEHDDESLHDPTPNEPLMNGDVLWVVGETKDVFSLINA